MAEEESDLQKALRESAALAEQERKEESDLQRAIRESQLQADPRPVVADDDYETALEEAMRRSMAELTLVRSVSEQDRRQLEEAYKASLVTLKDDEKRRKAREKMELETLERVSQMSVEALRVLLTSHSTDADSKVQEEKVPLEQFQEMLKLEKKDRRALKSQFFALKKPADGRIRKYVEVPGKYVGLIIGKQGSTLAEIRQHAELGSVSDLKFIHPSHHAKASSALLQFAVIEGSRESVQAAKKRIQELMEAAKKQKLKTEKVQKHKKQKQKTVSKTKQAKSSAHVFVDNSNVFIGAQNEGTEEDGKSIQNYAIRIKAEAVAALMEKDVKAPIVTRIVGGSTPPATSVMWNKWKSAGYQVELGKRSPDGEETFVDDMIVAQIQGQILKYFDKPQTLVLATGDGNRNDGRESFVTAVTAALMRDWEVHLWSWKQSTNRVYKNMAKKKTGIFKRFHLHYFDDHRKDITFKTKLASKKLAEGGSVVEDGDAGTGTAEGHDEELDECVVCMERPRSHTLFPCGHLCLCGQCVQICPTCPICRTKVTQSVKVILS